MLPTPHWLVTSLWGGAFAVTAAGLLFARQQNRKPQMGGEISKAKQIWLIWAVYAWFVLTPLCIWVPAFTGPLQVLFIAFSVFMGLRGLVEVFMLFVTKNWRPPMGILHDVACVFLLATGQIWVLWTSAFRGGPWIWGMAWAGVLTVSLGLETYYAVAFNKAVKGRTTGADGIWFADGQQPRFAKVNRVTAWANLPLIAFVVALLVALSLPTQVWAQGFESEGWSGEKQVQLPMRSHDRPLTTPQNVFDIVFDAAASQVSAKSAIATLGAGMRYGVDNNLEVGLRMLRVSLSDLPGTGLDRPTASAAYRVHKGPFEAALRFEGELPVGSGPLQYWLQPVFMVRVGSRLRLELSPLVTTTAGSAWQWAAAVPFEASAQLTKRLRLYVATEVGAPDLRENRDLLMLVGGGLGWTGGKAAPVYEVLARISGPAFALAGQRAPDPAIGNYFSATVTLRLFFQGMAEDPNEPLF